MAAMDTLEAIAGLEAAVASRAAAWADEEAAWTELVEALDSHEPAEVVRGLIEGLSAFHASRQAVEQRLTDLEQGIGALVAGLEQATTTLAALVHDPGAAGWDEGFETLRSEVAAATLAVSDGAAPLRAQLAETVVGAVDEADEAVTAAVRGFADAVPELSKAAEAATMALAVGVRDVTERAVADMRIDSDAVKAGARALGIAVLDHQMGHAVGRMQDLVGFRGRLQEAIQAVSGLSRELETLRTELDGTIQASTRPIADIRAILSELLQRFRSL